MPTKETIENFIKAVKTEPHDKVIAQFYTDDASIQENQDEPRIGKENLIKNEKGMLSKAQSVSSKCIRPVFQVDNRVIIKWHFRFEWKDHSVTEIEELAYQEWEGDRIQREQFFYNPKQFVPKKPE
ncbi:MAG: nuclear transport factor 2 family protein [Bacteroidota bacterium]